MGYTGWKIKTYKINKTINIHTSQNLTPRKWNNFKLYGISYEMSQFGVDLTENGFAAAEKVDSGIFDSCKS